MKKPIGHNGTAATSTNQRKCTGKAKATKNGQDQQKRNQSNHV
jgi:hypothetical protein